MGYGATDESEEYRGVRFLDPKITYIHLGTHNALHVTIAGDRIYPGVWACLAFPVSSPDRYISLHYPTGEDDEEEELGVIRDLTEFPPEAQRLVRESLVKRYFVHRILKINSVKLQFGFLHFDVVTDKGRQVFMMRWQMDRAQDYGEKGKVLIDAFDNRYLIPDVSTLSKAEVNLFTRFIYW